MSARVRVRATSEVGALRTVVMCFANPCVITPDPSLPDDLADEASTYQMRENPMRTYDHDRVHEQQRALVRVLREHGAEVLFAQQIGNCITQHYTRDVGFAIDELFFVARPRRRYRRREIGGLTQLLARIDRVRHLDAGCIEGGDVMLHGGDVLVGRGEETDVAGVDALRRALAAEGSDRTVRELHFNTRGIIHLDTKLNVVAPGLALVDRHVFEPESLRWIERTFEPIDVTAEEARNMEVNTLAIGNGRVVMRECSRRLADEVARRGLEPVLVDYSEVTALPGSFRCTTLPVERADDGLSGS